jgi:hypothetical protein
VKLVRLASLVFQDCQVFRVSKGAVLGILKIDSWLHCFIQVNRVLPESPAKKDILALQECKENQAHPVLLDCLDSQENAEILANQ